MSDQPQIPGLITKIPDAVMQSTLESAAESKATQMAVLQAQHEKYLRDRSDYIEQLNQHPVVEFITHTERPLEFDESIVFERRDGDITNKLAIDFVDIGLPEPPEDVVPLALVMCKGDEGKLESLGLLTLDKKWGTVSKLFLEPSKDDTAEGSSVLDWKLPGAAKLTSEAYEAKKLADNENALTLELVWRHSEGLGYTKPENMTIVMNDSEDATEIVDIVSTDKKIQRLKKVAAVLAGVTMLSWLGSVMPPSGNDQSKIERYEDYFGNDEAEKKVDANFGLFKAGNIEALDEQIAHSEFAHQQMGIEIFKTIEDSQNIDELTAAMDVALSSFNIDFRIPTADKADLYDAAKDLTLEDAKSSALGILDGINELGIIAKEGKSFDIELVRKLYSHELVGKDPAGHYDQGTLKEKPIIRITTDLGRRYTATATVHETGHHENLDEKTIYNNVTGLNRRDFKYGKNETGNGVVGKDIVSEYAGSDTAEDIAEMVTYLLENPTLDPTEVTAVQEKLLYVLASLEVKYPGISALVFRNASKPSDVSKYVDKIGDVFDAARQHSKGILVLSLVLGMFLTAEVEKNETLVQKQKRAGIR